MAVDIRDMLADHSFFATERELNSIMSKFDRDRDSKIAFSEFVEELSPKLAMWMTMLGLNNYVDVRIY